VLFDKKKITLYSSYKEYLIIILIFKNNKTSQMIYFEHNICDVDHFLKQQIPV